MMMTAKYRRFSTVIDPTPMGISKISVTLNVTTTPTP
ncbi:MAG: hypothetical protein BWX50_00209 [Euryarchaeota archaeon ADurb.Bin009]|nr:MAG: hypothetical protein BWX50_00209 [Euryarchaeota archaeon ADurb.Bin009]